ncbi:hypothetical protein [Alicyclobacillus sp. ALC3]|uniref:hypothetical protein n=1 Tax=Alicyclobacillus sp. ALC3 TaxID=2796143 RepID=UPI002379B9F9|nr:hypothetical protein [Alicyclobacillus sp. ALC3]
MWEMMNGMADGVRGRFMPRRNRGVGTMTAMLIGASVGIAAWEAWRRTQPMSHVGDSTASRMAQDVIDQLQD